MQDWFDSWDTTSGSPEGHLVFQSRDVADSSFAVFSISAMVDTGGEWRATVTPIDASSTGQPFSDNEAIVFQFVKAGDKGQKGQKGATGSGTQGPKGQKGATGPPGEDGLKYAIVDSPDEGTYIALSCVEMPDVRFDEIMVIQTEGKNKIKVTIDKSYIHVCEPNTIQPISYTSSEPCCCGLNVSGDELKIDIEGNTPEELRVKLSGIRK